MNSATQNQPTGIRQGEQAISLHSVVVVSREQISCDLLGEAVILDLSGGVYYGLDEVGARVWASIQAPRTVSDVCEALLEEYDVERPRCESDLLILLQELRARNLIEVTE